MLAVEHYLLAGQPRTALRALVANEAASNDAGREATLRWPWTLSRTRWRQLTWSP